MKLETYTDLSEKEKVFKSKGYLKIDTVANFENWYGHFSKEKKFFRGVNEAKYKIYTSAQRKYITNDLRLSGKTVEDIIDDELSQVKSFNNNLLKNYFELLNVDDFDPLYLSFLQHYSGISPLIDFTVNINIALYFMQDSCCFAKAGSEDIDNYTSLYYMLDESESTSAQTYDVRKIRQITSFSSMRKETEPIIFGSQKYNFGKIRLCLANLNLIAQEGRFVFYCNDIKPLEENIYCVDIHKSLAPYIKKKLDEKGITKDSIYPQEEIIAKKALQRALENI